MENKNHLQALLLVVIVLAAVLLGGTPSERPETRPLPKAMEGTARDQRRVVGNKQQASEPIAKTEEVAGSQLPTTNYQLPNTNLAASVSEIVEEEQLEEQEFAIPAPLVSATSAIVKNLFDKNPLFSLNPNQQWPLASLTKLMTAVIALEKIPEDARITVSSRAVATEGVAGYLVAGRIYTRDELLQNLLVYSSNDAGVALAEYYDEENPSETMEAHQSEFVELMNRKAVSLGMYNTRYFDPHGLSPLNQSMASDLEKLMHHVFNLKPEILEFTREKEGNTHPFVEQENYVGGKTGFLDEAGGNLITLLNYNSKPLLIVVLGSEDRASDTKALYESFGN